MRARCALVLSLAAVVAPACDRGGTADGDKTASGGSGTESGGAAGVGATPSGGSSGSGAPGRGGTAGSGANAHGGAPGAGGANGGASNGGSSNGGSGQGGSGASAGSGGSMQGSPRLPEPNAGFDYQIGGDYTPPAGVEVVSRDRESPRAQGYYNICYVNGFQVQPSEEDFWLDEHPELVLRDAAGDPVIDADWDEMLLDTGTPEKRDALAEIVGGWIAGCKTDGFDAVEIDNLDSYSRSQDLLTEDDNVAFVQLLAVAAHSAGLAIAQKNSAELLERAGEMQTDFAVVEECNRWDECDDYRSVYGDRVFVIEYRQQDFDRGCSDYPSLSIVLRDLNVSTPSSGSYVYDAC